MRLFFSILIQGGSHEKAALPCCGACLDGSGSFLLHGCGPRQRSLYGWQEGEPTPVGGFPATPTPVPVTTSFIEPNYYPDYDRITPPEEAETAPKTNAGSLLPQFALAAVAVGSIAVALKRTK